MCIHDKFLTQAVKISAREDSVLDLKIMYRKDLIWGAKARNNFGCSDREMVKFKILDGRKPGKKQDHNFQLQQCRL